MKKLRMILALIMALALIMVYAAPVLADTGNDILNVVVEVAVEIVGTLFLTLIGVLGAWLMAKLGQSKKLQNIQGATSQLMCMAQETIWELQQLFVDKWKAEAENGRLTDEQVAELGDMLYERTINKMSAPVLALLRAAQVDVSAVITGAGEAFVRRMKN